LNKLLSNVKKTIKKINISLEDIDNDIDVASKIIRGHSLVPVLEEQKRVLISAGKFEIKISKLQHWLIESKYGVHSAAIILVLVSLAVLFVSLLLDIHLPNIGWFQRGGSVVVCSAVYFAYKNYPDELKLFIMLTPTYRDAHEMVIEQQNEQRKKKKISMTNDDFTEINQSLEKAYRKMESGFAYLNSTKIQRLVRNTLLIEASVLVIGTIIWGYGDLLINFFK